MNIQEYVYVNDKNNDRCNDDVYGLVTKLSKHILQTYRSSHRNVQLFHDRDVKVIKHLRIKAFEILLKKSIPWITNQDCEYQNADPFLEIQKHAFALKLRLNHSYEAKMLEHLSEKLEEFPCNELPVSSVLQLLMQLKNSDVNPEPLTNIFYFNKTNPAFPEIIYNNNNIPPFQMYPMECFILSEKFEATLEKYPIKRTAPSNFINELSFLDDSIKSKAIVGIESADISVACDFMSSHMFDRISSHTLFCPNEQFTINSEFNMYILQNNVFRNKYENICSFPSERGNSTNYLYLPFMQTNTEENKNVCIDTWNILDQSVSNESNSSVNICNHIWNQIDVAAALSAAEHQTWEYFGEIQSIKELMFITDTLIAAVHLEKIKQMNNLSLIPEKLVNSLLFLEQVSAKEFLHDLKSMLMGVESNSFEYKCATGFQLRRNISVYSICSESIRKICEEAFNWGNCFKFLWNLVTPKSQSDKSPQEGLIFKAMCINIKELLLYYQAALLRIFTYENESEGLLKIFQKVRSLAALITKVAKVCEPYKKSQYMPREGSNILTRIYNEAIKITDTKIALVFYSLLKSCCEVYFHFLQKWMFEGICDDIYGEFMIKTRPQYLRNRSHKFWTKSFSICNDEVPGFLNDLAESILQCGKTVRLLRTCDSKNPVCRVCVTEQPGIKVCLSIISLREQSSRYREYEKIGRTALGSVISLSTAILNQKRLEKEMSKITISTERDTLIKIRDKEREGNRLKTLTQANVLTNPQTEVRTNNLEEEKAKKPDLSNKVQLKIENDKEESTIKATSRSLERTIIWNYYESLANDINKRCIRSQWRTKRMKLYNERVDALSKVNQESRNEFLKKTEEHNCVITPGVLVETPISLEDENKNYTDTSFRTSNVMSIACTEIDQEDSTQSSSLVNYADKKTISNNNEKQEFHNFERLETLNTETTSEVSSNRNTTNKQMNEILEHLSVHCTTNRSSVTERPTRLNVTKIDNITVSSQIGGMCMRSLDYKMTPNNNELDIHQIEFTSVTQETNETNIRCIENIVVTNKENDLETPMSCTTDNFTTSSVQSPVSITYNLEDSSPSEISSTVMPSNSSNLITKSPLAMKEDSTFSDLFELARDEKSNNISPIVTPLSITDVEIIDHISLQAYLEKSVRIPLNVQSRLVNDAIRKYFLIENNLLSHLHSLRSYFFLLNGEFSKSLTDSLYARLYEISIPIELFNSATLTNVLERALVHSFNNVYINSELLSLSATDTPVQLHISDPAALDCLTLNYKINWPLNIIFDETVMQQYRKVFKFLITSGRVSWVLQEDFNIMKRERKAITSEQYHKLQLYRHSMTQFMNALHNYLTCSVLHASWAEFEKDLEQSLTVDQIYVSHVNYIKRILSRCMLNSRGEKVRVCLTNIFKVILKFHNRIRSQNWIMKSTGYVHPNFKKLEQMYQAFFELRAYMSHVAFKLATSGYQPHLMHFLNALNINPLYDLTVKKCSSMSPPEL
ncbi:gamma-tubulin complex component 6 isoform X2 [Frieseomelitta varia]|uniref:gamma-tubulin complex component 6 isoform X2 n=1 Tax=Frieseomelitta varia TaxID=561572 RepID=UPI001CB684F0|nr:gamma-tubulin complex component 6 isoform X2 [Frieseomelitta varia]